MVSLKRVTSSQTRAASVFLPLFSIGIIFDETTNRDHDSRKELYAESIDRIQEQGSAYPSGSRKTASNSRKHKAIKWRVEND